MGRALAEKDAAAAAVFAMCDAIRPGTSAQCFEGAEEELRETRNTQPCLFAMELAAAEALRARGVVPDAAAGFSLGEVAAAAFCGLFDPETGFRLVCRRGELMQREAERFDTAMAAVVRLTPGQVEAACARYSHVFPVNYNCPGQISVSGLASQMADFDADIRAAGGRAIPLKVRGGFHSPFMNDAADAFAQALSGVRFRQPAIALYSNVTAQPYAGDAAALLARQIKSPVLWEKTIRAMIAAGVDAFIEIGPGQTLTNMIRKISTQVQAQSVTACLAEETAC